jgi:hypothetical protein
VLTRTTKEVLNIRHLDSIYHTILVRWRTTPTWLGRLLGKKESFWDVAYVGCGLWRNAATGRGVSMFLSDWLAAQLDAWQFRQMYKEHGEVE